MKNLTSEEIESVSSLVKTFIKKINLPYNILCEFDDLLQVGLIAAWKCKQRFNESKEASFISYAYHRIKGAILDEFRYRDWRPRSEIDKKLYTYTQIPYEHELNLEIPRGLSVDYDFDSKLELDLMENRLTGRSKSVFHMVRQGKTDVEIAKVIGYSSAMVLKIRHATYKELSN